MEKYEGVEKTPRKKIIIDNFLGGFSWALGATIGLSIIIAIIGFLLKHVNFVPAVGNFIYQILVFILSKNPNLQIK